MASTVVVENVRAKVEEVSKRGKEGSYKAKVVKVNNKEWTISKDDKDRVNVGQEYDFKLSKSEYNDKLYYWANLISNESSDSGQSSIEVEDELKKKVFDYLNSLDKDKKKSVIDYLLKRI